MRNLPVDVARIDLISTGKVMARPLYEDGKRIEGRQAVNDDGVPMWIVDVIVDQEESLRSEAIGVAVPSPVQPVLSKWRPVIFVNLDASIYRDKLTGQPKVSLTADSIKED